MLQLRLPIPRFISAGEVFMDKGAMGVLKAIGSVKAFVLISDSASKDVDFIRLLEKTVGAHALKIVAKPAGEPTLCHINQIVKEMQAFQPDWIIAIGGGSVLDSAKIAWAFYEHPALSQTDIEKPFKLPRLRGKAKLACLPTTIGTGSEVSSTAVYFDESTGTKKFLVSHEILPDLVILDPLLLKNVPYLALAYSGLDALTHAVEGYVSRYANPFLDTQAVGAIRILLNYLPNLKGSLSQPEIMLELMIASMMAGWVQNMKVPGLAHALAHQMGQFNIPHGLACGIFLPAAIEINSGDIKTVEKYNQLASSLGFSSLSYLKQKYASLFEALEISAKLYDYVDSAIVKERQEDIITQALLDPCAKANPLILDRNHVAHALSGCMV